MCAPGTAPKGWGRRWKKYDGEDNDDNIDNNNDNNNDNDDDKVQQLVSSIKSQFGEIARLCFP